MALADERRLNYASLLAAQAAELHKAASSRSRATDPPTVKANAQVHKAVALLAEAVVALATPHDGPDDSD